MNDPEVEIVADAIATCDACGHSEMKHCVFGCLADGYQVLSNDIRLFCHCLRKGDAKGRRVEVHEKLHQTIQRITP